jgi:nicotinamidase-related amidase
MAVDVAALVAPAHTALVLQEMQEGVVGGESALPELAAEVARVGLVDTCARLAHAARAAGVQVVHCTAENRADFRGANHNGRLFAAIRRAPVQLRPGSFAARPVAAIGVAPEDLVLPRGHGLSPMLGTHLDVTLRNCGIRTVVAVGISLNLALTNLALDAVNLGYQVVIPRDGTVGVPREYGELVLEHTLGMVTTVTTADEVVAAWSQPTSSPSSTSSVSAPERSGS